MENINEFLKSIDSVELIDQIEKLIYHNKKLIIGGVSFILSLYCWYRRPINFPPGPVGVPGLGVVPFLDKMAARSFTEWGKKYEKGVMSVRMGGNDLVIINRADVIKKTFTINQLRGRPAIKLLHQLAKGKGIFFVDDTPGLWEQRKFMGTVLKKLGMGKSSMDLKIFDESRLLCREIETFDEKPFDILYLLTNAVSNNACLISLGTRFDYDNEVFQNLLKRFCNAFYDKESAAAILAVLCYSPLAYVPTFSKHVKEIISDTKYCLNILSSILEEKQKNFDIEQDPNDFAEYFFLEKKKNTSDNFTDEQLLLSVKDILFGGTITTTTSIRWIIYALIEHEKYQNILYKEIVEIFGEEGNLKYDRKQETPLLMSFIYEVMRYHTAVPLGVPHSSPCDVTVEGYTIPKGTPVFANIYACHHDPKAWAPDPDYFRPERHIADDGRIKINSNFMPFGVGNRKCIGDTLAMAEIYIFTASLIRQFKFYTSQKLPQLNNASLGLLNIPAKFDIIAKNR